MLRPERMSRVSITGSKTVMDDVIATAHDLHLIDLTNYDGGWAGFEPGNPTTGADDVAEKLVTVRSLQSILGVEDTDAGPERIIDDGELDAELERVREDVNALDDRRDSLTDERRTTDERIDSMRPFERLGIDLDLLSGYDSLETRVGEGDHEAVERELRDADAVDSHEVMHEGEALAVFAYLAEGERDVLDDVLVGAEFAPSEIPDVEERPDAHVADLHERRSELDDDLESVESDLDARREESGAFLLAAEEHLAIDLQKREAPLSFATTKNAFVAEGWIPTERFVDLADALEAAVGEHCAIDELERASYDDGHATDREPVESGGAGGAGTPEPATDGGTRTVADADGTDDTDDTGVDDAGEPAKPDESDESDDPEIRADGGTTGEDRPMATRDPPVVQDNAGPIAPFEMLTKLVNRPLYAEFDPTFIFFLTFPALFGFMIGDLGYGILYFAISYGIYSRLDSVGGQAVGAIGMWAGVFTMLFGVLYGEIFGLHQLGEFVWAGHPPIHKGLQPEYGAYAQLWITASVLFGLLHLTMGYIIDFVETSLEHGVGEAVFKTGSWLVMMLGLWAWIFSVDGQGIKPGFLYTVFAGEPFAFGFDGLPALIVFTFPSGIPGLGGFGVSAWVLVFVAGLVLLAIEDALEIIEFLQVLVNVLSYTRLAAVVLAKAGLAFVVNLLVLGAYEHEGAFHFLFFSEEYASPSAVPADELMFAGLFNGEGIMLVIGVIVGILVLVFGHLLVLALGLTSAGLQAIRLEYVEFLSKSRDYDGGGRPYEPFGRTRSHTAEE